MDEVVVKDPWHLGLNMSSDPFIASWTETVFRNNHIAGLKRADGKDHLIIITPHYKQDFKSSKQASKQASVQDQEAALLLHDGA